MRRAAWRTRTAPTRDQFAAIVQASQDAVISETADGTITNWNRAASDLYGYSAEEMIGRGADILYPPHRRAREHEILARINNRERIERLYTERIRKDGTKITVTMTLFPVIGRAGRIEGVVSVSRAVSERLRAETKFQALLEATSDAIIGVRLSGEIVLVNQQAARLFGYEREELIGQPIEMLIPAGLYGPPPMGRAGSLADGPRPTPMGEGSIGSSQLLHARRRDGGEFPAEVSLSPLQADEDLVISAAIRDVTDRLAAQAESERPRAEAEQRQLDARLHEARRLESLGQLAGGVAHDFNNLLAVVMNYASFVAEEITAAATESGDGRWKAVLDDVDEIQRAAERARALTHQLLAFGRRETVQPQVLSLNRVVTDLEQVLRRTVGERVQVRIRLRPDAGSVLADHGQLEQVLVNLALNARDAMPDDGVLTIETERLELDAGTTAARAGLRPGPHLRLRVSDTGAGIPDDLIDRVFEPFFTTKPKGESSGLGLATVYGVISQSGGHTEITSELGTGTSVTCLLPVTDVRPVPASPPAPLAVGPARGGGTILLVEDEDPLREVTLRILTRNGYRVLTASGGAEALDLVTCPREAGDEIDLLVTDVIMPGMQGRELAGRVQAQLPAVRVVYMSGYAHPVLTTHGWLDPGVVLLEKPFTERDLLDTVRRVLSGG